jgi:serine protease AprX
MAAWRAGIVVVTAAGNEGPAPMTIGVPGNVPYVITTGALTDNYTRTPSATTGWPRSHQPGRHSKDL